MREHEMKSFVSHMYCGSMVCCFLAICVCVSPSAPDLHVYLIIHNIDGPMLRGEKTQSALGQLASIPNLHLVASIDHINAPLGMFEF